MAAEGEDDEKEAIFGSLRSFAPACEVPGGCLLHVPFAVKGGPMGSSRTSVSVNFNLARHLLPPGIDRASITSIRVVAARTSAPIRAGVHAQLSVRSKGGVGSENQGSEQIWTDSQTTAMVINPATPNGRPLKPSYEAIYFATDGKGMDTLSVYTQMDPSDDGARLARVNLGQILRQLESQQRTASGWAVFPMVMAVTDEEAKETYQSAYTRVVVANEVDESFESTRPGATDTSFAIHVPSALAFVREQRAMNPFIVCRSGCDTDETTVTLAPLGTDTWGVDEGNTVTFTVVLQIDYAGCNSHDAHSSHDPREDTLGTGAPTQRGGRPPAAPTSTTTDGGWGAWGT